MSSWGVRMRRFETYAGKKARGMACLVLLLAAVAVCAQTEPADEAAAAAADTTAGADTTALADSTVFRIPEGTEVSGDVSGIWETGTYIVTESITIQAGDSLTIAAGCSVLFMGPKTTRDGVQKHYVNSLGKLWIDGREDSPVVFTSVYPPGHEGRRWGGLIYLGNKAEGYVEHARISQSEIGIQVRRGLVADAPEVAQSDSQTTEEYNEQLIRARPTGPVKIRHTTIDSASFTGIVMVGIDSTVVVADCQIRNCSSGISCEDNANPVVRDNLIYNNVSTGIICSANSNAYIVGCTIVGSATAGVILANNSNAMIEQTVIAHCGIGVSATGSSPIITRSSIAMNDFSGVIAYENAAPSISNSNIRDNGLSAVDNRSSGEINGDRCWWGYIITETKSAPVLDARVRREQGITVASDVTGRVYVLNPLESPSADAPGTPDSTNSLEMSANADMSDPFTETGTVTNLDTIYMRLVARDESPHLEDQATIIISTTTGDPEGTQRVLNESGTSTGTYDGFMVASLAAGDPNVVVRVQNGDIVKVESRGTPPITRQVTFISKPPVVQRLRINGRPRGVRLLDDTPSFTWKYWDNEDDPLAGIQIELGTDPSWTDEPLWKNEETGHTLAYTYDGPALARAQTYYLRVRANDGYNWGPWKRGSFHMNVAPPTPVLSSPEDGAIVKDRLGKPTVAVENVVDRDGDRVTYIFNAFYGEEFENARMRIKGALEPVLADTNSEVTRYNWTGASGMYENTRVWWRVKASDGLEESEWSDARSFTLDTENDPVPPFSMLDPQPDSSVRTIQPRFEWGYTYDPDPSEDVSFLIKYSADSTMRRGVYEHVVERLPEVPQFFHVPPFDTLEDNAFYWWRVAAMQDGGVIMPANSMMSDTSSLWKFFIDTGNDPPRVERIPLVTLSEDTPTRMALDRYIFDPDNTLSEVKLTVRSTLHVTAEVVRGKLISLTPEPDWYGGPETIRIEVEDPNRTVGIGELRIEVRGTNDAPTTSEIPPQTVVEDTDLLLDLEPFVADIDSRTDAMTWTARTDNRKLIVEITRGTAKIRSTPDWFGGPVPIRFTATDQGGLSSSTSTEVTVTATNDGPRVDQIPEMKFEEDKFLVVDLNNYVTDPDNRDSELSWTAEADEPFEVTIDPALNRARIRAPANWSGGKRRVVFIVRDPDGLENRIVANFEVEGVNDPPEIAMLPAQQFNEDREHTLELDQFVSDPDNASREMVWRGTNAANVAVRIDAATRRAVFSAPSNWHGGPERVRLSVTDPGGLSARRNVEVTVRSVPEAPVVRAIPEVAFEEDGRFVVRLDKYLSDPDHGNAQLNIAVTQPANVRAALNERNRRLTLSAPPNWNGGPEMVAFLVTDPDNEQARGSFRVNVTAANDAPTLSAIPEVVYDEDASTRLTLTDYVSDPDNAPGEMTWTFSGGRNVRTQVSGGIATFSSETNWNGNERLTLTATDPGGLKATAAIKVKVNAINDAPVVSEIPAVSFNEDGRQTVNLNRLVADDDNADNELTWTYTGNTQVSVNVARGRATFTAVANWNGQEQLTFTATDPGGLSATGGTSVTVSAVNDPPTLSRVPAVTFAEDQSASMTLTDYVSDPDNAQGEMSWAFSNNKAVQDQISSGRATLNAGQNWNGSERLTLTVTDPGGLTATAAVSVTVTPVNDTPVLSPLPAVRFDEDGRETLNLNALVADVDDADSRLNWTYSGNTNAKVAISRGVATFSAVTNWHGTEQLTFTATDRGGLTASGGTAVTVVSVNDAPVVSRIPAATFNEDESTQVDLAPYGSDIDGEALTWSATSANQNVVTSIAGARLSLSAAKDWNGGPVNVTVSASDPGGLSDQKRLRVTVTAINDAPVLSALPAVRLDEDGTERLNVNNLVADVDNSDRQLNWTVSGKVRVKADVDRGVATFAADANWFGTERLTFTATDPGGLSATGNVSVTVASVNDAPVVSAVPPVTFDEDQSATVDLSSHGSDVDNDALTWTATSANPNLTSRIAGSTLTLSGAADWNGGPVNVAVSAADPGGLSARTRIRVTVKAVNDAPVLSTLPAIRLDEDGTTTLALNDYVNDVDDATRRLTWPAPEGAHVKVRIRNGVATITADENWNGQETLSITVNDRGGLSASQPASVTVVSVNDAPTLGRIPAVKFKEDESTVADLSAHASDVDGDALNWSATSPDPNLVASVSDGRLNLSAAENWSGGPLSVSISVLDPAGLSAQSTVRVTVEAANDAPTLSPLPPVTFDEDGTTTLSLAEFASDIDNSAAQMSWTTGGGSYVKASVRGAVATFRADKDWSGTEQVTVTVRDRGGLEATGSIQVTVNPVNDAPTASSVPSVRVEAGDSREVDLSAHASDVDGDRLSWSLVSQTGSLDASVRGSTLRVAAQAGSSGRSVLTLSVSDPSGQSKSVQVTVNVVAPPPPPPPTPTPTPPSGGE